jgi:sulfonate transport system substrate-binding protein
VPTFGSSTPSPTRSRTHETSLQTSHHLARGTALAGLVQAADLKEIRIAVPDLSAGTQHSGGGVVDVLRDQQIFEKAFADQGIKIQWNSSRAPAR